MDTPMYPSALKAFTVPLPLFSLPGLLCTGMSATTAEWSSSTKSSSWSGQRCALQMKGTTENHGGSLHGRNTSKSSVNCFSVLLVSWCTLEFAVSAVHRETEDYVLPRMISAITGQVLCLKCACACRSACVCEGVCVHIGTYMSVSRLIVCLYKVRGVLLFTPQYTVPFGDAVLATHDTVVGFEICEELYCPVK